MQLARRLQHPRCSRYTGTWKGHRLGNGQSWSWECWSMTPAHVPWHDGIVCMLCVPSRSSVILFHRAVRLCHCRNSFFYLVLCMGGLAKVKNFYSLHTRYFIRLPPSFQSTQSTAALLCWLFVALDETPNFFFAPSSVLSVCCIDCYCRHKTSRHSVLLLSIFLLFPALLSFLFGVSLFFRFFLIPLSNSFFFAAPIWMPN